MSRLINQHRFKLTSIRHGGRVVMKGSSSQHDLLEYYREAVHVALEGCRRPWIHAAWNQLWRCPEQLWENVDI